MKIKLTRYVIARGNSFMEDNHPSRARFGKLEKARLYSNVSGAKSALHQVQGAGAVAKPVTVTLEV